MASYQDLETRVNAIEERLKFVMQSMRGRIVTPTGLLGVDGRPTATAREVNLEEMFLLSKQVNVSPVQPGTAPITAVVPNENSNG